jgi:ubiquinone/menaquinone biosynthesis C-methylase UbiE
MRTEPRRDILVAELTYNTTAAQRYEQAFAHVTAHFIPRLLRAAALAPGQSVLDVATGTGLAAEAALGVVGPGGHVTASDASASMAEQARHRLAGVPNAAVGVEDGQAMSYPSGNFDAVLCSLGLMFFPDPARGLAEFHRVLRSAGRAAVSVLTVPERSYNGRINVVAARHLPQLEKGIARTFGLGDEVRIRAMFAAAGFSDFETSLHRHDFILPSFDAYYEPFEAGGGSTGEALAQLPEAARQQVREEVRRSLGDTGGPVTIPVEFRIASGRK